MRSPSEGVTARPTIPRSRCADRSSRDGPRGGSCSPPTADVPAALKLVRTARELPTLVVVAPGAPAARVAPLEAAGVTVVRAASLAEALRALRAAGIDSMLVEGGGRLAGALLAAGLVDRYYWVQTPLWLGAARRARRSRACRRPPWATQRAGA